MNQAEILKRLLAEYRHKGGDLGNVAAASVYINAHKPAGVGRVNEVICAAIIKQMGVKAAPPAKPAKPMLDATPLVEPPPAPVVIATRTVVFPEAMPAKPVAVYFEAPPSLPEPEYAYGEPPLPPVPIEPSKPIEKKQPDPVEVTPATPLIVKARWMERMKFWKKK